MRQTNWEHDEQFFQELIGLPPQRVHAGYQCWVAGGSCAAIRRAMYGPMQVTEQAVGLEPGQDPPALAYLRKRASEKAATTAAVNAAIERFSE